uniref:Uncharacterized protein n=1 Tax=Astyanax mexicanus TaxID=7994 RepID=A0A8B9R758_ASTMX
MWLQIMMHSCSTAVKKKNKKKNPTVAELREPLSKDTQYQCIAISRSGNDTSETDLRLSSGGNDPSLAFRRLLVCVGTHAQLYSWMTCLFIQTITDWWKLHSRPRAVWTVCLSTLPPDSAPLISFK